MGNCPSLKRDYFISFGAHGKLWKITIPNINIASRYKFSMNNFPMRYNSESAQVKLVISGNSAVFEDLKISSGFFISHGLK